MLLVLKTLLNDKKILCILPMFHNNKYTVDLEENREIFDFLTSTCSLIPNKNVLPSKLTLLTENSWSNCHFSIKDILQIIKNLDSNKAHANNMIIILMLKLCGDWICKSLELCFKTCLQNSRFPLEWKLRYSWERW